jgi:glycosyltransferase involved in cell wall biosynthesis
MEIAIKHPETTQLSIIIPVFNSATTIVRCLESIRCQCFSDYEIVIQDGGSRDNTIDLVMSFERDNPSISVKLQQQTDRGVYDAMNKAVLRASGEWLYFLGSDDELHDPRVLERVMGSKAVGPSNVMYGNVKCVGRESNGEIYDGRFTLTKLLCKNIIHQAIFYRASFARDVGEYNIDYAVMADWDYNMRCRSKTRFSFIDLTVAIYCMDGISGHGRRDLRFEADRIANITRYFDLSAPHRWVVLNRIDSASKADMAYAQREEGNPSYLSTMTSSIVKWPFGDVNRYRVWLHMLLTQLGILRKGQQRS